MRHWTYSGPTFETFKSGSRLPTKGVYSPLCQGWTKGRQIGGDNWEQLAASASLRQSPPSSWQSR